MLSQTGIHGKSDFHLNSSTHTPCNSSPSLATKIRKEGVWEYTTRPAADYSRAGCDGNLSSDQVWGGALPEVEEVNESDEINQQVSDSRYHGHGSSETSPMSHFRYLWSRDDDVQRCPGQDMAPPFHEMLTTQADTWAVREPQKLSLDVNEDNDVYRALTQDRRNLVLDSICPNLAPHIVITPPVDIRDDYYSPFQNSIAPQWLGYLVVPPSPLYLRSSAHWPPSNESRDSKPGERSSSAVGTIPDTIRTTLRPSRTVFSPSKFAKMIEQSSVERLILYHVTIALHKCQRKASAFAACSAALSFRSRYDSPDFIRQVGTPFTWTDAADPLLLISSCQRGATVIDSSCPLAAPHIIINEAPSPDPWTHWQNATNDPQDYGYGRYLTVPSRSVDFVNKLDKEDAFMSLDVVIDESPPQTPLVNTPLHTNEDGMALVDQFDFGCNDVMSSKDLSTELSSSSMDKHLYTLRPCDIFVDELGGDDLPPFDNWYTTGPAV